MENANKIRTRIFVDSCAWNVFFDHNVNLSQVFPTNDFEVLMTKEIRAFEIESIPDLKEELRDYIQKQIEICDVKTHSFFGFSDYGQSETSTYRPRIGGFNEGYFVSCNEAKYLELFKVTAGKERRSGLYNDEADASLAVRACSGGIVLTAEGKSKSGPLKRAAELGGRIVFLCDFANSKVPFEKFLKDQIVEFLRIPFEDGPGKSL